MTKGCMLKPKILDRHEKRVKDMFQTGLSLEKIREILIKEYKSDWKERSLCGKYR